jgi:methionyl aminopeptidase
MTAIKTAAEIASMRKGGYMLEEVLNFLTPQVVPGASTGELADLAATKLKQLGGQPAFLGYQGFPSCICISVNEEVVHGIPGNRIIEEGDLVGLDFGVLADGLVTDSAVTVAAGVTDREGQKLLRSTREALMAGIGVVRDGVRVGDISAAVEARLLQGKLGIVRELVGHGVGHRLHEPPEIPNYGKSGTGPILKAGMTIAIEPMATLGKPGVGILRDNWTVVTLDGSRAAQFEHTVLVTAEGAEILTQAP